MDGGNEDDENFSLKIITENYNDDQEKEEDLDPESLKIQNDFFVLKKQIA